MAEQLTLFSNNDERLRECGKCTAYLITQWTACHSHAIESLIEDFIKDYQNQKLLLKEINLKGGL